jgi:hypothetical protein
MPSPTATRPGTDRRPLLAYLRVQRDREREMIAILQRSSARINRELAYLANRPGIGAAVRREQLLLTQVAIQREISDMWSSLGRSILAGRADAAAAAARLAFDPSLLRSVFPMEDIDILMRSAMASAREGIATVEARAKLSRIPLAESVYKNRELTSGKIDAIVDSALSRGASARELANDVRRFIRPDVRGGIKYAALRLGRTELNNAFHAQQVVSGVETPWVTGMRWNLSGSHPRPDECNEYADEKHEEDMPAGVFSPENVPGKPHPNCLCFMTSETVSRDEFIRRYEAGDYNDFTDRLMRDGAITFR